MKPYLNYAVTSLISILFASCQFSLKRYQNQALLSIQKRFPELPIEKGKFKEGYELVRSVEISHPAVTMALYSPQTFEDKQYVILLSNAEGQCYAVPYPSLRYKSYWNYVFDTSKKPAPLKGGNFEYEINKALSTLNLNTQYDGNTVLSEMFRSLLGCHYIRRVDSLELDPKNERYKGYADSCMVMQSKTFKTIMNGASTDKYWRSMAYWSNDGRIFHFDKLDGPDPNKTAYFKIRVFRLPCVVDPCVFRI
ncbi:hypothetical protein [Mucilaginibacter lacusdianchii]|uniref:hypothetical protein n=1 Tax=Mucilaginibacter lacusdianchii TaxID=2684211 RepID=UPI00131DBA5B|nr:hypothetical protein [Mucilaginibacter sp. JXJ CY 39]